MEFIQLSKDVLLVKNSVENPQKLYDIVKKSKQEQVEFFGPWTDWKPWGNYSKAYPRVKTNWIDSPSDGGYFVKQVMDSFFSALKYYKENCLNEEYFNLWGEDPNIPTSWEELIDMPESFDVDKSKFKNPHKWEYGDLLIAESVNTNPSKSLSMEFHKDRRMWLNPSPSFFNYNVYINDDYKGGEIQFVDFENAEKSTYINKDGEEKECWLVDDPIIYRMEAGDGMLFRTDHPHSVFPIKGNKYYVRHFLIAPQAKELINYQKTLSNEDFINKLAEIEKDGFENKQWHGKLFATKEEIDDSGHPKEQKYVLKSGNKDLVSSTYRFEYKDGESPSPVYVTDPLYDFNQRKDAIEI